MVSSRKRGRQEMEAVEVPKEPSLIERIRNMWEFANLAQYIFIFGNAVKIDENLDIEELEMECLKSHSTILPEIGLALLKFVSSHRGLTPEIFDEYTRRQYIAKAPESNPFGVEEDPEKFIEFDVFTKIRVLQQLSQWTFGNPDRIRERMVEQKDSEQTFWRVEPFGWDSQDRTYFVLDDNRLYRRTDPPPPPPPAPKPKKNSKKAKAALRASKRRRVSTPVESDTEPLDDPALEEQDGNNDKKDTFGGMKWECLAITLEDFNKFLSTIDKSRDPNEKLLRKQIADEILPLLEKQEEARKRKAAQKERELLNLEKLATAKRSSRIAGRQEQQKQEEEAREADRKKQAELAMAKKEQEKWMKLEKERESRMMTREQRVKEREARRILHEEELANLSEDSRKLETGLGRLSERHLKAEIEKKKKALEELAEEDDWIFDCICGAYGKIDDGTHSIACDKCNIWQHSKCVGVSQAAAEREDFHFICQTCKRRAEDAERAKNQPPIKIKIHRPGSSSSPMPSKQNDQVAVPLPSSHEAANGTPNAQSSPQKSQKSPASQGGSVPLNFRAAQTGSSDTVSLPGSYKVESSTGARLLNGAQIPQSAPAPSSGLAFSSPKAQSPYVLAPPAQPQVYPSGNGHPQLPSQGQQLGHKVAKPFESSPAAIKAPQAMAQSHSGPASIYHNGHQAKSPQVPQSHQTSFIPAQITQSSSVAGSYGVPPTPQNLNGQRQIPSNSEHRRSSINMSSPLSGAPVLTPMNKPAMALSANGSPTPNFATMAQSTKLSPSQSSPIIQKLSSSADQDPGHASALPPAISGLSPTKHSPPTPRQSTFNGTLVPTTPSVLPPVASLSPSPQLQNLTPPVKISEPERNRQNGQSVGP